MEYEVAFGHNVQMWTGEKRKYKVLCLDIMSRHGWEKRERTKFMFGHNVQT